jgi:hypothetical protein
MLLGVLLPGRGKQQFRVNSSSIVTMRENRMLRSPCLCGKAACCDETTEVSTPRA